MINVVIGAGYGDEGKGLLTDFYASKGTNSLVVRFNGGAQAGHTVITPTGKRHVFNHFGSGTFIGAKTLLSRFFIVNPIVFFKELKALEELGVDPFGLVPFVEPQAVVTTPYDMLINQMVELGRGDGRHGSVGLGIGETIERNENSSYPLTVGDLNEQDDVKTYVLKLCEQIRAEWVPRRLLKLGVVRNEKTEELFKLLEIFDDSKWAFEVEDFLNSINVTSSNPLAIFKDKYDDIVFEGAQGLMLDQHRGAFPYVTRSNCGLKNVIALCKDADIDYFDVTYVTRAYVTRHGRGPLAHELFRPPYEGIEEKTNVLNTFQEHFRYAYLDVDILTKTIQDDLSDLDKTSLNVGTTLAITCLDQLGAEDPKSYALIADGTLVTLEMSAFLKQIFETTKLQKLLISVGPTRETINSVWTPSLAEPVPLHS